MAQRARQRMGLLLAAVLVALAVSVPSSGAGTTFTLTAELAAGVSATTNPAGLAGRPAATPSVLRTSSPADPMPFGIMPSAVPPSVLARLSLRHQPVPSAPYAARRPAEGDRAPPAGS